MNFAQKHPVLVSGIVFFSLIGVCSIYMPQDIAFSSRENLHTCLNSYSSLSDSWIHEYGFIDTLADKFHSKAFSPKDFSMNLTEVMNQISKIHNLLIPIRISWEMNFEEVLQDCSINLILFKLGL